MKKVVSTETMRNSDKFTIENYTSGKTLMYRAGEAVYRCVNWFGRTAIVCGKGNNAGDGFVLASLLKKDKINSKIILLYDEFSDDGKYYFEKCRDLNIDIEMFSENTDFSEYNFIVDCIFGTGFKGDLREKESSAVTKINESRAFVVSVDINSGLNGDNGLTSLCVRSDLTVSIGTVKSGHLLNMAKDKIKRLVNCDIGIEIRGEVYGLLENTDVKAALPDRLNYSYKGIYGTTAILGGCENYTGAVKLANLSMSSLRSGCGISRIIVPKSLVYAVTPYLLESTLFSVDDENGEMIFDKAQINDALKGVNALAIGMGWGSGKNNPAILSYILNNFEITVLIDADGINALLKIDKNTMKNSKCKIILTPHLGEFSRLTGLSKKEIEENPIEISKSFALDNNLILLLKGPTTIITDGRKVFLSSRGSAGMATAGSGDVLSGVIIGLMGYNECTAFNVACGAFICGAAGEIAAEENGKISMTAGDTVKNISSVIKKIKSE